MVDAHIWHLLNNRAIRNGSVNSNGGFVASGGPFTFLRNTAIANFGYGIIFGTGNATVSPSTFSENSLIGNGGPGFIFSDSFEATLNPVIRRNNIFGNANGNGNGNVCVSGSGSPHDNCGLINCSSTTLNVANNYWGAPSGPGTDPADNAGGVCDTGGGTTVTAPFGTTAFPVN